MIPPKELRAGNIVKDGPRIYPVTAYQIYEYGHFTHGGKPVGDYRFWEPVLLTEEILTKWCGFYQIESPDTIRRWRLNDFVLWELGKNKFYTGFHQAPRVESLHDLQNFYYYTLNKKELEVKIPTSQ